MYAYGLTSQRKFGRLFDRWHMKAEEEKRKYTEWKPTNFFFQKMGAWALVLSPAYPHQSFLTCQHHSTFFFFFCLRPSAYSQSSKVKASQAGAIEKTLDGGGGRGRIWLDLFSLRPPTDILQSYQSWNMEWGIRSTLKLKTKQSNSAS